MSLSCYKLDHLLKLLNRSCESVVLFVSFFHVILYRCFVVSKQGGKQPLEVMEQTVLVCFLGGVTYSEIASLRFLGHVTGQF